MSQFGHVFSVKITQDKSGANLNYGYLSFVNKESKDNCLQSAKDQKLTINGCQIQVQEFKPFNKRQKNQNNIFIKNLIGNNQEKITEELYNEAKKYGQIISHIVKFEQKLQKYFGFICYKNSEDAKVAFEQLQKLKINHEKIEVNWAQKKEERTQSNIYNLKQNIKKTNIFLKNLSESTSEDQLKEVFKKFGQITSVCIKNPTFTPSHIQHKTKFGFINFEKESMAQDLLKQVESNQDLEEVKELFFNNEIYVVLYKPKEELEKSKVNKKLQFNQQNIMQMMTQMSSNPQMFFQTMQQMMMMNMMMLNKNLPRNYQKNNIMPLFNFNQQSQSQFNFSAFPKSNLQQNNFAAYQYKNQQQPIPQQLQQQSFVQNYQLNPSFKITVASLKENLNEFLKYDQDRQRSLLGELLFPQVNKYAEDKIQAPKITGMLIDFEVFEVTEILEFLENEELLKERIKEAEELIENTSQL